MLLRLAGVVTLTLAFTLLVRHEYPEHWLLASAFFFAAGLYDVHEVARALLAGRERFAVTARVGIATKAIEAGVTVPCVWFGLGLDRGSWGACSRKCPKSCSCTVRRGGSSPVCRRLRLGRCFVVTTGTLEAGSDAQVEVEGYCRETECRTVDSDAMPRAFHELSDHCPVVLEVKDQDLDARAPPRP